MRVFQVQQSRPDWYDRNAVERGGSFTGGAVAPHATTARFTYTVPSGKKFLLEAAVANIVRSAAAAVAGTIECFVRVLLQAATSTYAPFSTELRNGVGDGVQQTESLQLVCLAGTSVTGFTGDSSTTGTVNYVVSYKGTEFDA